MNGFNLFNATVSQNVQGLNGGSSSGGGTTNYSELTNKPKINGVTLSGNLSTSDLKIHESLVQNNTSTVEVRENDEFTLSLDTFSRTPIVGEKFDMWTTHNQYFKASILSVNLTTEEVTFKIDAVMEQPKKESENINFSTIPWS